MPEWEKSGEYDELPLRYVCYLIAWKLILNRKTVGKVTEEDLVIAPSDYWGKSLRANVENMLQTKEKRHQRVRSEGTAVTVKVNELSQARLEPDIRSQVEGGAIWTRFPNISNVLECHFMNCFARYVKFFLARKI